MGEAEDHDVAPLRVEVVTGGDPGDLVLAAVAAVLTRPRVVVADVARTARESPRRGPSRWTRAARLEGTVPGRRIATTADLSWQRAT